MWRVVKWTCLVVLSLVILLFIFEIHLPKIIVDKICYEKLSSPTTLVRCDGGGFGLKRGLRLKGIRVYDLTKTNRLETVASAKELNINLLRQLVRVKGAKYPRLPDSYYSDECHERNEPVDIQFPDLPDFRLELEKPSILGLEPARVTAQVRILRNLIALDEIHVEWPGYNQRVSEDGYFRIDFAEQRAHGEVRGVGTQRHIRPLIVALDVPAAMPYYDGFTEVPVPVNASGEFDVNLVNNDFKMRLDLRPELGKYNGVSMARAEGKLDLDVQTRGTNCNVRFRVDLPMALDSKGRQLAGMITVNRTNEAQQVRLDFNVLSKLDFVDILRIADIFAPETLDFIQCETAPEISAVGHTGTEAADSDWNSLAGSARLWRGSVFGFKVRNLSLDYALEKETLSVSNVRATGKGGGELSGEATVYMPGFDEDKMTYHFRSELKNGTLDELADAFALDLAGRNGTVNSSVELWGPICTNAEAYCNGQGHIRITDGHLLQMNLFAGLTKQLADWVPGVGYIVNQSQASVDYTITNGVVHTDNLYIEGGLVSLKGWGSYDVGKDDIDFNVRVQFLKKESLLGKLVHPITWPFTKLLLEFKATGSIDDPKWDYISVIDRMF